MIIPLLLLLGCNDNKNNSSDSTPEEQNIAGIWITSCFHSFNNPEPVYSIAEYHITEDEISHIYNNYSNPECTNVYSESENLWEGYTGTYIRLGDVTTTSGIDAKWIEVTATPIKWETFEIVIEIGLYQNNDELRQVLEEDGMYIIAIEPNYILK